MTVYFESTNVNQNRISGLNINGKPVVFDKGIFKTTDKEIIEGLMAHSFYARGRYELASDPKNVGQYLASDEEPDYIDKDYVNQVSDEAVIEIGKIAGARNDFPSLIRAELQGKPVTTEIADIVKADLESQEESEETSKKKTKKKKKSSNKKKK